MDGVTEMVQRDRLDKFERLACELFGILSACRFTGEVSAANYEWACSLVQDAGLAGIGAEDGR